MKAYQLTAVLLASRALADSILDWYDPKSTVEALLCANYDTQEYLECNEFGNALADKFADNIMATCKEASCSGSFTDFDFDVSVEAVFPPEAKGEFETQVHNIMRKMHMTDPAQIGDGAPSTTAITFPSKMILNRVADDTEKGSMTITISNNSGDGMCEVLKYVQAAGGTIPEVGGFFGLIGIADC